MTCNVLMGTLNLTHSLTHSLTGSSSWLLVLILSVPLAVHFFQRKPTHPADRCTHAGMAHSDCRWMCGCEGKTARSLENTCHTWALLRWWFTKWHYIKCTYTHVHVYAHAHPLLTLNFPGEPGLLGCFLDFPFIYYLLTYLHSHTWSTIRI